MSKKLWYSNGEKDIQIAEGEEIPYGFSRGRKCLSKKMIGTHLSDETKQKISSATKGRVPHNKGKQEKDTFVYYTNGDITVRIKDSDTPPDGFIKGRQKRKLTDEEKQRFNDSRKQTNIDRYGDENYNNHKKAESTCFSRYGVSNPMQSKEVQEKVKKTTIDTFGYDNVFAVPKIKEQIKNTKREKFGYENSFNDSNILQKAITNSHTDEANQKRMNTCMEHFGVPYSGCLFGAPTGKDSKPNLQFKELLIQQGLYESDENNREKTIGKYRYDFCINDILIEINPSATHNVTFSPYSHGRVRDKEYHRNKTLNAKQNNYHCISIFDWDDTEKIINLIKNDSQQVMARKCEVQEVSLSDAYEFLFTYHLQGKIKSDVQIALMYDDKIVSLMTFGRPRYNKNYEWELLRYCSSARVVGGAEKLFSYFVKTYNPESVISYCDLSKFSGDVYEKLGFSLLRTSIGKHWYHPKLKIHITDNLLRQRGFDQLFGDRFGTFGKGTSNEDLMRKFGFVEIYDCGQNSYVWNKVVEQ